MAAVFQGQVSETGRSKTQNHLGQHTLRVSPEQVVQHLLRLQDCTVSVAHATFKGFAVIHAEMDRLWQSAVDCAVFEGLQVLWLCAVNHAMFEGLRVCGDTHVTSERGLRLCNVNVAHAVVKGL